MSGPAEDHPHEVLLIDQRDEDVALLSEAIARSRFADLHVIGDAGRAVEYLHHRGRFTDATTPCLIVVDASRAEQHGFDVLVDVMSDRSLHEIPVIVLVEGEQEVLPSYLGGHWSIVRRPLDRRQVEVLLATLSRQVFGE